MYLLNNKARAKREKQIKNFKFLIKFFVFRHLFPLCFLTNETPEKLANVFSSDQKQFCWKNYFLLNLFISSSVFPSLEDIWFKNVAEGTKFRKTNKNCTQNLKRYCIFITFLLIRNWYSNEERKLSPVARNVKVYASLCLRNIVFLVTDLFWKE